MGDLIQLLPRLPKKSGQHCTFSADFAQCIHLGNDYHLTFYSDRDVASEKRSFYAIFCSPERQLFVRMDATTLMDFREHSGVVMMPLYIIYDELNRPIKMRLRAEAVDATLYITKT